MKKLILICTLFLSFVTCYSVDVIWTGASSSSWHLGSNWQGGVVPNSNDVAIFKSTHNVNVIVTSNTSVKGIRVEQGYTGTITKSGATLTVGTSGYVYLAKSLINSSADITLKGYLENDNGSFTYTIDSQPQYGVLTVSGTNAHYQPNANYYGLDTFTYHVYNGTSNSPTVTVNFTVDDNQEANDTSATAKDLTTALTAANDNLILTNLAITANNLDWFKFTVTERSELDLLFLFSPGNGDKDLDVYLYNSSLSVIGQGETGNDNEQIVINDLPIGTYYIKVMGWAGATNLYEMRLVRTTYDPDDRFEVNDTQATAANLTTALVDESGQLFEKNLNIISNNVDFYKVTLSGVSNLIASLTFTHASGNLDLQITDSNGTVLGTANTTTNNESLTLNSLPAGDYFIKVYGVASAQNVYNMVVQASVYFTEDTYEANDTKATAWNITSDIINGNLQIDNLRLNSYNEDWFKFTISAESVSGINVLFTPGNGEYDLDIALENATGSVLVEGLSGSPNENLSLTLAPGTYYLQVYGWSNSHNDYALNMVFTPTNQAPVANSQSVSVSEDNAINISLTGSDPESQPLTYSVTSSPANGILTGAGTSQTYTPNANFNGTDFFTFTVSDGVLTSATATINITVLPVNDAPVAQNQMALVVFNSANSFGLNSSDVDGDTLTFAIEVQPLHGVLTINGTSANYQPTTNYYGSDVFTYHVNDTNSNSQTVTVSIKVDDAKEVNDTSATAKDITSELSTGNGILNISNLIILPSNDDWFQFTVTERSEIDILFLFSPGNGDKDLDVYLYNSSLSVIGQGETGNDNEQIINNDLAIGTYYIKIMGWAGATNIYSMQLIRTTYDPDDRFEVNDTQATAANLTSALIDESGQLFENNLNLLSDNEDFYKVTLSGVSSLIVSLTFTHANGNLDLQITDSNGTVLGIANSTTNNESLTLNSLPAGDYFVKVYGIASAQNEYNMVVQASVYFSEDSYEANDTKATAWDITANIINGNLQIDNLRLNSYNEDWFKFTINTELISNINVLFTPGNGEYDLDIALENAAGTVLAEGLSGSPNENLSLTLAPGTYYLQVYGWANSHNNYALNMSFNSTNQAPTAFAQNISVNEDNALNITLTGSDPESQPLVYSIVTSPIHGVLTGSGTSQTYTPVANYYGPDSFTFKVSDGAQVSSNATVSLTVLPVNDAPVAVTEEIQILGSSPILLNVLANDIDVDADTLLITAVGTPTNGTAVIQNNQILYTPNSGYSGQDSFSYTISDGVLLSSVEDNLILVTDYFPPLVQSVSIPSSQTTYYLGNTLDIVVTFDFEIAVTGVPSLLLAFQNGTKYANYTSGTGTNEIHFAYTVQAGDFATSPMNYVDINSLILNGGTMTNNFDTNVEAELALPATTEQTSLLSEMVIVDAVNPLLVVDIPSGTYSKTQVVTFTPQNINGGTINVYYTTDGSTPTLSSSFLTVPNTTLNIYFTQNIKAFASNGTTQTPIIDLNYIIQRLVTINRLPTDIYGISTANLSCYRGLPFYYGPTAPNWLNKYFYIYANNGIIGFTENTKDVYDLNEHATRMNEIELVISDLYETGTLRILNNGSPIFTVTATPSVNNSINALVDISSISGSASLTIDFKPTGYDSFTLISNNFELAIKRYSNDLAWLRSHFVVEAFTEHIEPFHLENTTFQTTAIFSLDDMPDGGLPPNFVKMKSYVTAWNATLNKWELDKTVVFKDLISGPLTSKYEGDANQSIGNNNYYQYIPAHQNIPGQFVFFTGQDLDANNNALDNSSRFAYSEIILKNADFENDCYSVDAVGNVVNLAAFTVDPTPYTHTLQNPGVDVNFHDYGVNEINKTGWFEYFHNDFDYTALENEVFYTYQYDIQSTTTCDGKKAELQTEPTLAKFFNWVGNDLEDNFYDGVYAVDYNKVTSWQQEGKSYGLLPLTLTFTNNVPSVEINNATDGLGAEWFTTDDVVYTNASVGESASIKINANYVPSPSGALPCVDFVKKIDYTAQKVKFNKSEWSKCCARIQGIIKAGEYTVYTQEFSQASLNYIYGYTSAGPDLGYWKDYYVNFGPYYTESNYIPGVAPSWASTIDVKPPENNPNGMGYIYDSSTPTYPLGDTVNYYPNPGVLDYYGAEYFDYTTFNSTHYSHAIGDWGYFSTKTFHPGVSYKYRREWHSNISYTYHEGHSDLTDTQIDELSILGTKNTATFPADCKITITLPKGAVLDESSLDKRWSVYENVLVDEKSYTPDEILDIEIKFKEVPTLDPETHNPPFIVFKVEFTGGFGPSSLSTIINFGEEISQEKKDTQSASTGLVGHDGKANPSNSNVPSGNGDVGNQIPEDDPRLTGYTLDIYNRVNQTTLIDGTVINFVYDDTNKTIVKTIVGVITTKFYFDTDFKTIIKKELPDLGSATTYTYENSLIKYVREFGICNVLKDTTEYQYDTQGLLMKTIYGDSSEESVGRVYNGESLTSISFTDKTGGVSAQINTQVLVDHYFKTERYAYKFFSATDRYGNASQRFYKTYYAHLTDHSVINEDSLFVELYINSSNLTPAERNSNPALMALYNKLALIEGRYTLDQFGKFSRTVNGDIYSITTGSISKNNILYATRLSTETGNGYPDFQRYILVDTELPAGASSKSGTVLLYSACPFKLLGPKVSEIKYFDKTATDLALKYSETFEYNEFSTPIITKKFDNLGVLLMKTTINDHEDVIQEDVLRNGTMVVANYSYEYNAHGDQTQVISPDGAIRIFEYNANNEIYPNLISKETDALGHSIFYSYNADGKVIRVWGNTSNPGITTYYPGGKIASFTCRQYSESAGDGPIHYKDVYTYSNLNLISKKTYNSDETTFVEETWTYDEFSRISTYTNKNGVVKKYFYNGTDQIIQEISDFGDATHLNLTTTYTFNSIGQKEKVDNEGLVFKNIFDSYGRITSIVLDPLGFNMTQVSYTYDLQGRQITVTDANGNTTSYVYNLLGQEVQMINPLGVISETQFDGAGQVVRRIADAGVGKKNATTEFFFDSMGRQNKVVLAVGQPYQTEDQIEFDLTGNIIKQIEDVTGFARVTTREYNDLGYLTKTILDPDATAHVGLKISTESTYNEIGQKITSKAPNGLTTQYNYNYLGRMTSTVVDPAGLAITSSTIFDAEGNVIQSTDADGLVVVFEYDAFNRQVKQRVDPNGRNIINQAFYHRNGFLEKSINPEGLVTKNNYDVVGRLVSTVVDEGVGKTNITTQFSYNNGGNITMVIDPLTKVATNGYDALNRIVSVTDAKGHISRATFDALGFPVISTDALGVKNISNYDLLGRLISQVVDPDGINQTTSVEYDSLGRITKSIKANGIQEVYEYDLADRKTKITQDPSGLNISTTYEYNNLSQLVKVTDAKNKATQYAYNILGKTISETYADAGTKTFVHNTSGQMTSQTDQNNNQFSYLYDNLRRLTTVNVVRGSGVIGTTQKTFEYDIMSRLTKATDNNGSDTSEVIEEYNTLGRLTTETQRINLTIREVSKEYNLIGKVTKLYYPNGRINEYTYDNSYLTNTISTNGTIVADYDYNAVNMPITKTMGNGVALNIQYNNNYEVTKHEWKKNTQTVTGYNYGRDSVGNRTYSENLVDANKSEIFAFDHENRLTDFKKGLLNGAKDNIVTPTFSQNWLLDSIGNWAGFTDNGTSSTNTFSDTHEMTEFKGQAISFDNNGNLTFDGIRSFFYDAFNRLIQVKIGTAVLASYQYDAFNRRIMKSIDANIDGTIDYSTKYLYAGFRCIEELDSSDNLSKEFVFGSMYVDEVISQISGATEYYFTHDERYSVTSLTNSAGNIVESYEYEVYGERTASGSTLTEIGYTGQRHDMESTGLMYFKNRYYNPSMGQFTSRDLLGYVDGMSMYQGYFGAQGVDPFGCSQEEGHFYTTFLMAIAAGMAVDEATELAIYSQMPDEVADFDAIEVQKQAVMRWPAVLAIGGVSNAKQKTQQAIRWRDLVQKYLHALTGESAEDLRICLKKLYHDESFANEPWKKGFLIHAYEDTFAHTDDDHIGPYPITYDTGKGHLFDGTRPDKAEKDQQSQIATNQALLDNIFTTGKHDEVKKKIINDGIAIILKEGRSKGNKWVKSQYRILAQTFGYALDYDPVANNGWPWEAPDSTDIAKISKIPSNAEVLFFLMKIEENCYSCKAHQEQERINAQAWNSFFNAFSFGK